MNNYFWDKKNYKLDTFYKKKKILIRGKIDTNELMLHWKSKTTFILGQIY